MCRFDILYTAKFLVKSHKIQFNFPTDQAIPDNANGFEKLFLRPPVKAMFNIPALIFPNVFFLNPLG